MEGNEREELQKRLEQLERRVAELEATASTSAVPPPVQRAEPKPVKTVYQLSRKREAEQPQPEKAKAAPTSEPKPTTTPEESVKPTGPVDAEYTFGARVLPRVGIVVVILAMITLVGYMISNGWITPPIQFAGEILCCLALIGVGIRKLGEREDFGQVLIGGGSCALYVSLAGAHFYKDLLTGAGMLVSFAILSLINVGFGFYRSSRSFWSIGLLGGLVTSQFALADGSHEIGLALAGLIALPCAVLAFKNKWHDLAWVLWGSVQLSLMALHYGAQDLVLSTIGIYGSGILVLLIFAARFEYWEADDSSVSIPSLAVLTAGLPLMIWAVIPPETTALHNLIFGAILVGGSYALRADVAKRRVLLGGILVLTVVGPLGLDPQAGLYTFAGLAICSSLLSKFVFKPDGSARMPALWLATVQTTAAIVMYFVAISDGAPDRWTDAAMLGAIGAALASTIWPMSPQDKVQKLVIGLGALAGWPIVVGIASRLLYAGARLEPELLVIPNAMYALLVVGIGWRIQQGFLVGIGAFFTFVTCFMGLVVGVPSDFELPIWFGLNLLALATVFALMKTLKERTTVGTVSAVFMWPVVTKLLMALLSGQFGIDSGAALTISWVLYGGALIQLGFSFDEKPLRIFSLVVFGITLGKVVLVDMADLDPMIRVGTTALLGLALIGGGHMYVRSRKR